MEAQLSKKNARWGVRYSLALMLAVVLFISMQLFAHATAEGGTATVKAGKTDVKVRASAVNGSEVAKVNGGDTFTIVSSTEGSDGYTWYEITGEVNGSSINGYIRSDFVDVTEAAAEESGEAAPAEGGDAGEGGDAAPAETGSDATTPVVSGSISPMEPQNGEDGNPQAPQLPDGFHDVKIRINGREVSAWTNDVFYIFYASSPEGNTGWYLYDSAEGRWIRYTDFLLNSAAGQTEAAPVQGVSTTIVIVMGAVIAILLIACGFLAVKAFGHNNDDDDDDDDYDDDDEEDDDEEDYRPVVKKQAVRPQQRPAQQGAPQRPTQPRQGQPRQGQGAPRQGQGAPRQGQPVRRNPQGGAPVTRRSPQGGAQRPQQRQSRPVNDDEE